MATWLLLLLALLGQDAANPSWDHSRREWRGEVGDRRCLKILNPFGAVTARPGEEGTVPLIAHLQTRGGISPPRLLLDETPGECMVLEVRHPQSGDPREIGLRVDLGLRLPPTLDRIEVGTATGDIELMQPGGTVLARSTTGNIVATPRGSIVASTTKGRIELVAGGMAGGSELSSTSGDIRLRIAPDADLVVDVTSPHLPRASGVCHLEPGESSGSVHSVVCGKGGPRLTVRSGEGHVEVLG